MTDWSTISALATGGGTLVLAIATFASVRSSNRTARIAEQSLLVGLRPLLMPSRLEDPPFRVFWADEHGATLRGGIACIDVIDDRIYLAFSLRNAANGIAVLQAWSILPDYAPSDPPSEPDSMHLQARDLYIPAGDVGFWQVAVRDPADALHAGLLAAIEARRRLIVDILYSDHEGGQRVISRFSLAYSERSEWEVGVGHHWNVDRDDPRPRE
jgi:hypothetical protein